MRALFVALALLVPLATACGGPTPPEKTDSSDDTQTDAGQPDASTVTSPDAPCDGGTCDGGGPIAQPPDAGPADGGPREPVPPAPLTVVLSAPSELLVRSGGSAALRVGIERREDFTGPVTLGVRGLPPEVFVADRWVSEDTGAVALVLSASGYVGPGTRIDATLVATAHGRSASRPLRLLVSGPAFTLDPTFPVVPFGWTDSSRPFTVQADGKLLVARAIPTDSWMTGVGFVLERYHADGAPDLSFGTLGTVTHRGSPVKTVLTLQSLPTGGSLMASADHGCRDGYNTTPCRIYVSRHLATGALDTSFGDTGIVSAEFGYGLQSHVKLLADGAGRVSAIVPHWALDTSGSTSGSFYGVQRWEANGKPVEGFGNAGKVSFPLPSGERRFDQFREALQRKDGSILIAVTLFDTSDSYNHALAFARVDGASGEAGWAVESSYGHLHRDIAADGHGRLVSLVSTYSPAHDLVLWQYDAETGWRLSTGTTAPTRLLAVGSASEVFFDTAGNPYTVGQAESGGGLAVVRFTRQGKMDLGFGTNGLLRLDSHLGSLSGFTLEPNGCLLARTWPEAGLVRLWP